MVISTDGDLGDIVFTLAVISGVPNPPHTLLARVTHLTKSKTQAVVDQLVSLLKPLVERQSYIKEFRSWKEGDTRDWDSGGFRLALMHNPVMTLCNAYQQHFKLIHPTLPCGDGKTSWLTCDKSPVSKGRIIINRTDRYRNEFFQWREIIKHYGSLLLFVGTMDEHRSFTNEFGHVEFMPTKNMLEVAELIAGSEAFIGNQSCANAIAEGLKHRAIQETSLDMPDCIFKRPNVQHVIDGSCVLPAIGVHEMDVKINRPLVSVDDIDQSTVPPKKWVVKCPDGTEERNVFLNVLFNVGRNYGLTQADILKQNVEEYRDYFFNSCYGSRLGMAKTAMANA